jgi:hypothetical protein
MYITRLSSQILVKLQVPEQEKKFSNIKFDKIPYSGGRVVLCGQRDMEQIVLCGQTDV